MGSIPASRTIKYITAIGEMDIILVFETRGVGSIPAWPAKTIQNSSWHNSADAV